MEFSVAKHFSTTPGGRLKRSGPHSGEELRARLSALLTEAAERDEALVVDLDGSAGYAASFLDEAFGPLASHPNIGRLVIESKEQPELYWEIAQYISDHNHEVPA